MRRDEASIFATIRPELALDRLNGPINAVPAILAVLIRGEICRARTCAGAAGSNEGALRSR